MVDITSRKDQRALANLRATLGQQGSGRLRYAAAMHFNRKGLLSNEALEVFRICSPDDGEDPGGLLRDRGLTVPLLDVEVTSPELCIRSLVDEVDRYLSALESPGVAEVRMGIAEARERSLNLPKSRGNKVVSSFLDATLTALEDTHPALSGAIRAAAPLLHWVTYDDYPPEEIGPDFRMGHAFASLVGGGAPIPADDYDLGLFLIAPHVFYRDHRHAAPELYAPLTGPHGWRFGPDMPLISRPAHQPVWNEPFAPHATKVGPIPFLCIFGWTRDVAESATVIPASDWAELDALRLTA
ncbi:MAG: hypothetical protein KDE08_13730 [Rhodobacteraceae bacterium]|nr:hypothetical protein [Paracoccaceae bacterium]